MGCDGGTIPRRDELVRTKKKPEQKDKNAETVAKWKHCAISQNPLRKPIVACELGRLYNKEAVIEHILNKSAISSSHVANHITKLSDVKELNLTEKPDFQQKNPMGDEYVDLNNSQYICPVTGLDMNGKQKFYFVWKCGCVFSERAIKEVKSETCHKCGNLLNPNDIIVINGTDEEIEVLKEKMVERRRLAKLEKKKKRSATATETSAESIEKKIKLETGEPSTDSQPISDTKLTNGVKKEKLPGKSEQVKPSKVNGASVQNGGGSSKTLILPDKAQKSYSIAKDPNASDAYKSLFTTHKDAQMKEKQHWITHNPLYY
ncbi:replication termination factor 2-like [Argiope bruennichi]|uniref:Replication termination factor 2 n=1 Tax=Argiope bruennichi TaxID=94029 RepID=A0A8T0EWH1_ARGBR|nr:replication termination factor 2-like [Argiope bruennichi]KAF8782686.1 Replication termination factor 2 like protein [Argiope bruennichi]